MKPQRINPATQPPESLYPPFDHHSEEFKAWCIMLKQRGYSDQYIAGASGENITIIRRHIRNIK